MKAAGSPCRPALSLADLRRRRLRALCAAGPPPGLIAYAQGQPVGWVTLGPRQDFLRLARSPVMKPVDDAPVWSVVCFVVPTEYRKRGVAAALLEAAVAYAARRGARVVEAYPVDRATRAPDDALWFRTKSMFDKAGFTEVARRRPQRPMMRIELQESAR